jgi:hypothetical protein
MKVARHEVPGNRRLSSPSRRERSEMFGTPSAWSRPEKRSKKGGGTLNKMTMLGDKPSTPFPTGRLRYAAFPGASCQATIIRSLLGNVGREGSGLLKSPPDTRPPPCPTG